MDKAGLMKRYKNLNIHTLNRWLGKMRDSKKFRSCESIQVTKRSGLI